METNTKTGLSDIDTGKDEAMDLGRGVAGGGAYVPQAMKDLHAYLILSLLPLCGGEMRSEWDGYEESLDDIAAHMGARIKISGSAVDATDRCGVSAILPFQNNEADEEDSDEEDDAETVVTDNLEAFWQIAHASTKGATGPDEGVVEQDEGNR